MIQKIDNLVVCVPTSNRPDKIRDCLKSLLNGTALPSKIIVLDSSNKDLFSEINKLVSELNAFSNGIIELQHSSESISPSATRKALADGTSSEFLLYLDDDMVVERDTLKVLNEIMSGNPSIDILGCGVYEYGVWRDIGFKFDIGVSKDKQKFVSKRSIRKEWMDLHSISLLQVDLVTQPPFLVRRKVFDTVNFDPKYKWAYEIYDFFYACYWEGVVSYVTTNTYVYHYPSHYSIKTFKDNKVQFNKEGKKYFEGKWRCSPFKEFRKGLLREFYYQVVWRFNKRRMVKNKIRKDGVKYR